MNLRAVDLNLLVILDALLREQSVTGAARRLNLTQPAVSVALGRARALFGDPLLVRAGPRLAPTARALELGPRLAGVLGDVETLLAPQAFDPATAERTFVVSANDLAELLLLPALMAALSRAAPRLRLVLRSTEAMPHDGPEALEGRVDLFYGGLDLPSPPYLSRLLYDESFVALARAGHPAFDRPLDAPAFAALPQVLVAPRSRSAIGPIDEALGKLGLRRFVALTVTRFASLPATLEATDLVACVPTRFAARPEFRGRLEAHRLPFESPRFTMRLGWHRLHDPDPAHRWLRETALAASGLAVADRPGA